MAVVSLVVQLALVLTGLTVLGPGALAPADPLVLETVEVRRVRNGWGLDSFAGVGVVRAAVESCDHLGRDGWILTEDEVYSVRVVDCQQAEHEPLSQRGLVGDVAPQWGLGHQQAVIILWE